MKKRKLLTGLVLTLSLMLGMSFAVFAYDYTVTISGGGNGTVNGTPSVSETFRYEEQGIEENWFNPNDYTVEPSDSKYYFQGFHIGGQEELVEAMPVTKDLDLVASYGVKGEMVAYMVNYQDINGAELLPSRTFYGNVNDKPVVAFLHVENYQPQAYNLTKTLSENEVDNVFTFVYTEVVGEEIVVEEGGAAAGAGAAGAAAGAAAGGAEIDDNATPQAAPEQLIDLDDPDTPLAKPDSGSGSGNEKKSSALPWIIGGAAVVVIIGIILAILLGRRKRKSNS